MKILNNTTGRIYFNTTFTIGGKSGGDCGWIEPNTPPYDYPLSPGMTNVSISMRAEGIQYGNLSNEDFVEVESTALEAPGK